MPTYKLYIPQLRAESEDEMLNPGVSASYTLPAGANAYSAKDVIANSTSAPVALTFSNLVSAAGRGGYIMKARMMTDLATFTARVRLHLFTSSPTPINDNAQYTKLYANAAARVGEIDFPAAASDGTGSDAASALLTPGMGAAIPLAFVTTASRNLFGLVEVLDGFTSGATQHIWFELTADESS